MQLFVYLQATRQRDDFFWTGEEGVRCQLSSFQGLAGPGRPRNLKSVGGVREDHRAPAAILPESSNRKSSRALQEWDGENWHSCDYTHAVAIAREGASQCDS